MTHENEITPKSSNATTRGPKEARLVVHLGSHKAGSTSVQDYSYSHRRHLANHGIFYPIIDRRKNPNERQHSVIASMLTDGRHRDVARLMLRVSEKSQTKDCDVVFLSGEEFCKLSAEDIQRFSDICSPIFDSIEWVLVVRNLRDYAASSFKHFLRYSNEFSLHALTRAMSWSPHTTIENWRRHFSEKFHVISFDRARTNIVETFFDQALNLEVENSIRSNVSFDFVTGIVYMGLARHFASPQMDALFYRHNREYSRSFGQPTLDPGIVDALLSLYDQGDWQDIVPCDAIANRDDPKPPTRTEAIAIADRLMSLLSELRQHLASQDEEQQTLSSVDLERSAANT